VRRRAGLRRAEPVLVDLHPRVSVLRALSRWLRVMSRRLKTDIPGIDWRVSLDEAGERRLREDLRGARGAPAAARGGDRLWAR